MAGLNSTGYVLTPIDQFFAQLVAMAQAIFGPDINTDPNSIDGQLFGQIAESFNNLDQLGQVIFNGFNPNTANGNGLGTLVQLNYLDRQEGGFSTVPVQVTADQGTIIPASFVCQSNDGSKTKWQNTADVTVDATGIAVIQCKATVMGPLPASIGVITIPVTGIFGLDSITNTVAATIGRLEETDEQLRIRRATSTGANGGGTIDAIAGSIRNIAGVIQAVVYENNTEAPDENSQPGNSIYAIVIGGDNQDIANSLWFKKPAGIDTVGSIATTVVDTSGWPHTMLFDRPYAEPIYITLSMKRRIGFPTNGSDLIKAALISWIQLNQGIGAPVIQSELYEPIMESVNNTGSILSLFIGTSASPTTTTDIAIAYNALANLDISHIVVALS